MEDLPIQPSWTERCIALNKFMPEMNKVTLMFTYKKAEEQRSMVILSQELEAALGRRDY